MAATILKWIIVFLSLSNAGYMCFDGTRALITGDYLRPSSGEYAGQLGPWSKLVPKIGVDPMSTLMKSVFLLFGLTGLFITAAFSYSASWAWKGMLVFNILNLWNLYFGTASCTLQILLLIIMRFV